MTARLVPLDVARRMRARLRKPRYGKVPRQQVVNVVVTGPPRPGVAVVPVPVWGPMADRWRR